MYIIREGYPTSPDFGHHRNSKSGIHRYSQTIFIIYSKRKYELIQFLLDFSWIPYFRKTEKSQYRGMAGQWLLNNENTKQGLLLSVHIKQGWQLESMTWQSYGDVQSSIKLNISVNSAENILHNNLGFSRVNTQSIPHPKPLNNV
jgi:hypothetical protein